MGNLYTLKLKERKKLEFDIIINSNCNLNCCSCFRQAPLCSNDPRVYDLEIFKKDLEQIKKLNFDIESLTLSGGEPLINKNLFKYVEIIRELYPDVFLKIFTNGLYLEKCPEEFLQKIKNYNLFIIFSYYVYAGINYHYISERLQIHNIPYTDFGTAFFNDKKFKTHMVKGDLSIKGDNSKIEENYNNCINNCICLINGKLYFCSILQNIDKVNQFFGTNFKPKEGIDFIDIYKLKNPDDLFEKIGKPLDFCKFCNKKKLNFSIWHKSKREKAEWILE